MVNIKLDSKINLESDSKQFILSEEGRYIGFYNTLEGAIKGYFKRKIRLSEAKTISGLLEYHKYLLNSLQHALTPLDIEVVGGKK